jgi:transcriptional regulator with AAA-type ATPase domain
MPADQLLTFPDSAAMALSIRAKALLFHDPRSVALLEQVERIARSDATALVIGETGTGKELIRFSPLAGPGLARGVEALLPEAQPLPVPAVSTDAVATLGQAIDGALEGRHADLFHTVEALLVRRAFARCRDNQVQTARLLGITRNTLRTLLKRHGLLGDAAAAELGAEPVYSLAD